MPLCYNNLPKDLTIQINTKMLDYVTAFHLNLFSIGPRIQQIEPIYGPKAHTILAELCHKCTTVSPDGFSYNTPDIPPSTTPEEEGNYSHSDIPENDILRARHQFIILNPILEVFKSQFQQYKDMLLSDMDNKTIAQKLIDLAMPHMQLIVPSGNWGDEAPCWTNKTWILRIPATVINCDYHPFTFRQQNPWKLQGGPVRHRNMTDYAGYAADFLHRTKSKQERHEYIYKNIIDEINEISLQHPQCLCGYPKDAARYLATQYIDKHFKPKPMTLEITADISPSFSQYISSYGTANTTVLRILNHVLVQKDRTLFLEPTTDILCKYQLLPAPHNQQPMFTDFRDFITFYRNQ
jgi:hypothetical protein